MYPPINLQYRNSAEKNRDGIAGNFDEQALEVALSMNLYRGGTDASLSREAQALYYAAIEAQRLACINVRQNVLDAYNEIGILKERILILESNLASQESSKDAYKQQ
ncbi:MAG: TolC family protein, partial [Gammaproteobacteria bacterium]